MYGYWNLLYLNVPLKKYPEQIMVNFYISYEFFTWPQQGHLIFFLKVTLF